MISRYLDSSLSQEKSLFIESENVKELIDFSARQG